MEKVPVQGLALWRRRFLSTFAVTAMLVIQLVPAGAAADTSSGGGHEGIGEDLEALPGPYNPATDPGSLYNVARSVGLDEDDEGYTGAGVDIALIDTGVVEVEGLRHSNLILGPDFSFEDTNPEFRTLDTNGHGTHLAGIIVAADEAWARGDHERRPERVLGMAPGARLVSIKVAVADGGVDVSQVIAAINWVIANRNRNGLNIRVINLAFGTDGAQDYRVDPLAYAVERAWRAGIVVVVAAGNDGMTSSRLRNPAHDPYVIAVGAAEVVGDEQVRLAGFSNQGSAARGIDLAAPGTSIVSLRNPGSYSDGVNDAGRVGEDLVRGSGTSQAAAVVSGAVALLLEQRPRLTPDQVKGTLIAGAIDDGDWDGGNGDDDADASGPGFLQVDETLDYDMARYHQGWGRSTGTGSLDLSRGSVRVLDGGIVLEGEVDIFGNTWSAGSWSQDSWSAASWSLDSWSLDLWSGNSWSGESWSGKSWSGNEWSGNEWSGVSWSGNEWSGVSWSGNEWASRSWSSNTWSTVTWK